MEVDADGAAPCTSVIFDHCPHAISILKGGLIWSGLQLLFDLHLYESGGIAVEKVEALPDILKVDPASLLTPSRSLFSCRGHPR